MTFNYTGDGVVYTGSFALSRKIVYARYKFDRLSIAYDRMAAEKGILKKVFIQRVILKNVIKSWHKDVAMYVDNLHSMYNEYDLLTLEEAEEIVSQSVYVPPDCSPPVDPPPPLPATYAPNTILYSKRAAIRGKLEKVIILKSLPYQPEIYISTLKSMYNESDLITLVEAEQIIAESPPIPPYCPEPIEPPAPLPSLYPPNTILFSLKDAEKGKIVKVVILRSLPQSPKIYEDISHSLWNEETLVFEEEAKSIALDYWEQRRAEIQNLLNKFI
jgi:hypothetical protein